MAFRPRPALSSPGNTLWDPMADTAEKLTYASPDQPRMMRGVIKLVERFSGQRGFIEMYERAVSKGALGFFGGALDELGVTREVDEALALEGRRERPQDVLREGDQHRARLLGSDLRRQQVGP